MKKFILFLVLTAVFAVQAVSKNYNPSNTVFAWDLRDVLIERARVSKTQIALAVLKNADNKVELLKLFPNYYFWQDVKNLGPRPDFVMDEIVEKLTNKYPALAPYKNMIVDMMTQHTTVDEVIAVLKDIKNEGYQNLIASNVAQNSYNHMQKDLSELFELFDEIMLAHPQENPEDKWIAKPQPAYFKELRERIDQEKQIIFIDDKQINIDTANNTQLNIHGIKFENSNQLRAALIKLGILQNAKKS